MEPVDLRDGDLNEHRDAHRSEDVPIATFAPERIVIKNRCVTRTRCKIVEELKKTNGTIVNALGDARHAEQFLGSVTNGRIETEFLVSEHERVEGHAVVDPIVAEAEEGGETLEIADEQIGVEK